MGGKAFNLRLHVANVARKEDYKLCHTVCLEVDQEGEVPKFMLCPWLVRMMTLLMLVGSGTAYADG